MRAVRNRRLAGDERVGGDLMKRTVLRSFRSSVGLSLVFLLVIQGLASTEDNRDSLPRILIIGDSISLGYTPVLQGMLDGKAEIVRPLNANGGWLNCEGTKRGVAMLDEWLAKGPFDLIHFNFGLHDLKHVHPETGRNSLDPNHPQQSNLNEYEANLRVIAAKLKATEAKLLFATTTPYPDRPGGPLRRANQVALYNAVACEVMKDHRIDVNDLHASVLPKMETWLLPKNVHFRPSANLPLARQIASKMEAALKED